MENRGHKHAPSGVAEHTSHQFSGSLVARGYEGHDHHGNAGPVKTHKMGTGKESKFPWPKFYIRMMW